jgi:hypothetical protein
MTVTDHDDVDPQAQEPAPPEPPARAARGRSPRRRRPSPSVPVARFDPGRVADTRHRNPTWIVAGILLVVLSALGGVVLFTSSDDRQEVLVAARDLEPGTALASDDLRIERVALDGGVRAIPATDAASLLGRHATGRVPAGTMLAPAMFATDVPLGPDEVVVGAALDPGEAPLVLLEVGAAVELLDVTVAAPGQVEGSPEVAASLGTGTVWAVEQVATGQLWLSVRVERSVGLAVSVASASDRLRVALIGGG